MREWLADLAGAVAVLVCVVCVVAFTALFGGV